MSELRLRRHWVPLGFRMLALAVCLGFGYVVVMAYRNPAEWGEYIRVMIPPFVLASYWLLAFAFNLRSVVVTPDRVRVMSWPFPTRPPQSVDRDDIRLCYTRNVVNYHEGVEIENFYTTGVETGKGAQIDVAGPFKTSVESIQSANDIVRVLNEVPNRKTISIYTVKPAGDAGHKWRTLLWGAVFLLAILAGAVWEVQHSTWKRPPPPNAEAFPR